MGYRPPAINNTVVLVHCLYTPPHSVCTWSCSSSTSVIGGEQQDFYITGSWRSAWFWRGTFFSLSLWVFFCGQQVRYLDTSTRKKREKFWRLKLKKQTQSLPRWPQRVGLVVCVGACKSGYSRDTCVCACGDVWLKNKDVELRWEGYLHRERGNEGLDRTHCSWLSKVKERERASETERDIRHTYVIFI